jgi:protein-L-isoaspartate(D-aspartate) O-methyltransferase
LTEAVPATYVGGDAHPEQLRHALADAPVAQGSITSAEVEAAFRTVPRHLFTPGASLETAYADDVVRTNFDQHGAVTSSVSAPWLQATMLRQGGVGAGMRCLEVGSGGYNAALLAELVGRDGAVTTIDIDPAVTDRAAACLDAAGYSTRVTVAQADAEQGAPGGGPFDVIIVTVGAWDIPAALLNQLAADGMIVVPLRLNGVTRSIAFRRIGDHLESTSAEVCGFVPIQGIGQHTDTVHTLRDADGRCLRLRFDTGTPADPRRLDEAIGGRPVMRWSQVTVGPRVCFSDLHLWWACFLPGFCRLAIDDGSDLASAWGHWFPYGALAGDALAYQVLRPAGEDGLEEFGAGAFGAQAEAAAARMVEQTQAWDRQARTGLAPTFGYWPTGSGPVELPQHVAGLAKTHGLVTVTWPAEADAPTSDLCGCDFQS